MTSPYPGLATEPLDLLGRIMPASNHTFLARLGEGPEERRVVYKPVRGEKPLWDFPDGTLADREYAAWLVSDALGWDIVPPTVLRDGPAGRGMVQQWCEPDAEIDAVLVCDPGEVPPGQLPVVEAEGSDGSPLVLCHEDTPALRRMAVFDVVVNNTDRKGGHILPRSDGHRYGVDHGVCFHVDDKLRTVLWGWAGDPLTEKETLALVGLVGDEALRARLEEHLSVLEVDRTMSRVVRLLRRGTLPEPGGGWPSIPWPPW